jgi:hypothetical protein
MPDQNPRDFLLALLSDEAQWTIFEELAGKEEKELAPILRPHDEIGLHKTRELEAIGGRILAYRCFGPCWPPRQSATNWTDSSSNRRSFPIGRLCVSEWLWPEWRVG